MPNLSIKDVPESWAEVLRQRAQNHHRSLQGELMAMLERAVLEGNGPLPTTPSRAQPAPARGWKTIEQVAHELRQHHPHGLPSGPSSITLVREDRDKR